jgi:hypothetical protein
VCQREGDDAKKADLTLYSAQKTVKRRGMKKISRRLKRRLGITNLIAIPARVGKVLGVVKVAKYGPLFVLNKSAKISTPHF